MRTPSTSAARLPETRLPSRVVVPLRWWCRAAVVAPSASAPNSPPAPPWQCTSTAPGSRVHPAVQPSGTVADRPGGGHLPRRPGEADQPALEDDAPSVQDRLGGDHPAGEQHRGGGGAVPAIRTRPRRR